jgi:hypothetical protein
VHIFATDGLPQEDARRAAYDNGLRCWDRNIAGLVEPLLNRRGAVHFFITSDHSELMGEDGLWGHLHPTVRTAAVPMLLLTNRPSSDLARQFTSMGPATFYDLSRVVAKALGLEIKLADPRGLIPSAANPRPVGEPRADLPIGQRAAAPEPG